MTTASLRASQPLGFLNARLYSDAKVRAAFNDITEGNNGGCGTTSFAATTGRDGASGISLPNFAALHRSQHLELSTVGRMKRVYK